MFDDKYVDQSHGIPVVTFYADYNFKEHIPSTFIKCNSSESLIFTHQHCHSDCEIIYIAEGCAEFIINDEVFSLSSGDIIIANPYDIHYGTTPINQDKFSYYCIDFDIDFLSDGENNIFSLSNLQNNDNLKFKNYIAANESRKLAEYIINLHNAYSSSFNGWKLCVKGNLFLIFSFLFENNHYYENDANDNNFMKAVFNYIEENYSKPITSKDVAEFLSYNHCYFCRYFKKNFSCTFSEFLNIYRIKQATTLIENGQYKVSELTTAVGFNNFSYFSNTFKKYNGVLPSKYISKFSKSTKTEL